MRGVLGLHHRVAGHTTKFDRLHHFQTFVGRGTEYDDIEHRCSQKNQQPMTSLGHVEVEDGHRRSAFTTGHPAHLATPQHRTNRNQYQAGCKNHRQNEVSQDAKIRAALKTELLQHEQAQHQHQRRDRECGTDQTDRATRDRDNKISNHDDPWPSVNIRFD